MTRFVYSRIVIDIETGAVLERDGLPFAGAWELCKGGNSQAEMQQANQISQQQLQMQQNQLNMVNPSLQAIIQNGGMLPQQQAAMTSQAINGLGSQYKDLYGQLSQTLAARGITGGGNAGGGQIASQFGSLGAQEAGQQSQLLNQIQLQKGQQLQGALGMGLGEAQGAGSLGVQSLGIGQQAAQATDQAQTGFWGSLVGGLAGLGGSALTKYCHVAAYLYGGWYQPETIAIRLWLSRTWWMGPFTWFYGKIGAHWAGKMRPDGILERVSKRLFDFFLRCACE